MVTINDLNVLIDSVKTNRLGGPLHAGLVDYLELARPAVATLEAEATRLAQQQSREAERDDPSPQSAPQAEAAPASRSTRRGK
jgi:hypothetical protein